MECVQINQQENNGSVQYKNNKKKFQIFAYSKENSIKKAATKYGCKIHQVILCL